METVEELFHLVLRPGDALVEPVTDVVRVHVEVVDDGLRAICESLSKSGAFTDQEVSALFD